MKRYLLIILCLSGLLISPVLKAQTSEKQASVKVSGEVTTPLDLKLNDMQQFTQIEVIHKEKDNKDHTYSGVVLSAILQKAGVTLGKDLRAKTLQNTC
jgi:DMSO/TMAO reductase YedYZ molybdopterin-dependent catalytic subunit